VSIEEQMTKEAGLDAPASRLMRIGSEPRQP
jgi:hypothetical protein